MSRGVLLLFKRFLGTTTARLACFGLPLRLFMLTVSGIEGRLAVSKK